jgi:ribose transport system permease protein
MTVSLPQEKLTTSSVPARRDSSEDRVERGLSLLVFLRERGIIVLWLLMVVGFSIWAAPYFGTFANAALVANAASITAIFAAGVAFGVLGGILDLSLAGTASLAGVLCGEALHAGLPTWLAVIIGLAVGPVVGFVNAAIVQRGVPALIVTIATLSIMTGLASVISGGIAIDGLDQLHALGTDTYLGIPAPVYVAAALFIVGTIFMTQTRGGVRLVSVGGNAEAVRRAGVNVTFYTTLGFVLCGFCAALGGVVIAAFTTSASPAPNLQLLFDALTAVALSGMPLSGGRGSFPRVLVGALIIQTISSALAIKNVQPYWSTATTGFLLVAALLLERFLGNRISGRLVRSRPAGLATLAPSKKAKS